MYPIIKQMLSNVIGQIRKNRRLILLVYIPPTLFLVVLTLQQQIPLRELMADTYTVANATVYTGLVSNLGIMVCAATFAICVFTVTLLWRRSTWVGFFAGSAAFTLLLLLDDQFSLHEYVLPKLNIPEVLYVPFYSLMSVDYVVAFHKFLRSTDFALLLIAVAFLTMSAVVDVSIRSIQRIYHAVQGSQPEPDGAIPDVTRTNEDYVSVLRGNFTIS